MQSPAVSILLPVYNAAAYLPLALSSILQQTFKDFEVIAINDGSTDRSLGILNEFATKDSRIRIISRTNQGITRTLNELVLNATAPLLARMDADDISHPQRLELQVKYLEQHPDVVLLGTGYELMDDCGRMLTKRRPPETQEKLLSTLLSGRNPFCHPTVMMRADAVQRVNAYDPATELAEDLDLFLRLSEIGKVDCLQDVLLRYRLHAGSLSEKKQAAQIAMLKKVCESAWQRRGMQASFKEEIQWRPTAGKDSAYQFALQYGWWAFNSAQRKTAMIYGLKAVRALPFRSDGWRLLACAAIKPMKQDNKAA